jgi:hypothetical protein
VLTKPTVLVPGVVLAIAMYAIRRRRMAAALGAGLALGVLYELVMALRFHLGLLGYLRTGTGGYYAQLAAQQRWDAVLRADVLGEALRLPLTYGIVYGVARAVGARHRVATLIGLPAGLVWSIAGPYAAGVHRGPFDTTYGTFALLGFAAVLAATIWLPDSDAPSRRALVLTWAFGMAPLLIWVDSTAYADRLASTAWPGLVALIALVLAGAIRGWQQLGFTAALAPLAVLAVAVWMSLATLDGLHGYDWVVVRRLGWSGLNDKNQAMNLVLPAIQSSLAAAAPALGSNGTLLTDDPSFQYFLPPGRVDTNLALHCDQLAHRSVFVLLTSSESEYAAQVAHGLSTPAQWLQCTNPKLKQLTDGSNGYAVFAVTKA